MRTVLVPLDGSTTSAAAVRPGFALAARSGARVVAVRACEGEPRDEVEAYLGHQVEALSAVAEHAVLAVDAPVVEALLAVAADSPDSLVCMATHGRTGVRRAVLGSVAEAVVRVVDSPVVLVGPSSRVVPLAGERATVVVCLDDSEDSEAVVGPAVDFARVHDLRACLVEVIGPDEDVSLRGGQQPTPVLDATTRRLDGFRTRFAEAGVVADQRVLFGNDPARAILQALTELSASYVAVATHAHRGLLRYALGSVTAAVVRDAPCPALVVRCS